MTLPQSLVLGGLAATLMLVASPSLAQRVAFEAVDINADGFLDAAELLAVFDVAGLSLMSRDRNGDGVLSRDELRETPAARDDREPEVAYAADAGSNRAAGIGAAAGSGRGLGGTSAAERAAPAPEDVGDGNRGHGNDPDGIDEDNPGNSGGNGKGQGNGHSGQGNGH